MAPAATNSYDTEQYSQCKVRSLFWLFWHLEIYCIEFSGQLVKVVTFVNKELHLAQVGVFPLDNSSIIAACVTLSSWTQQMGPMNV